MVFVGKPAATWKERTSLGFVLSSYALSTLSVGGRGPFCRSWAGDLLTVTVLCLVFNMFLTSGIPYTFLLWTYHPFRTVALDTVIVVFRVVNGHLVVFEDGDASIPRHCAHAAKVVHKPPGDVPR